MTKRALKPYLKTVGIKNPKVQITLHVRSLSAQLMGLMMISPTAVQERDDDQEIPSDVSVYESCNLSVSGEWTSEALNLQEHDQQVADVERPSRILSEQTSGDYAGGDASDPIQSDGSERECQQPGKALNINLLQLWTEPQGMVLSGRLSSRWARKQKDLLLSKPCCSSFILITRYVLGHYSKFPFDELIYRESSPLGVRLKFSFHALPHWKIVLIRNHLTSWIRGAGIA